LSKLFITEECIKLVALRIYPYPRSNSQFRNCWWPGSESMGRLAHNIIFYGI